MQPTHWSQPIKPKTYMPELDALRGIAVLSVISFHLLSHDQSSHAEGRIMKMLRLAFSSGWLGVDLFFVLSGFLITGILLDTANEKRYYGRFYWRRLLRIFPLYYLVLSIVSVALTLTKTASFSSIFICYVYLTNFATLFRATVPGPLQVYWSLAVEEHFYMLWPTAIRKLTPYRVAYLSLGIMAIAALLRVVARLVQNRVGVFLTLYEWTPFRMDALAMGAFIAATYRTPQATVRSLYRTAFLLGSIAIGALCVLLATHSFSRGTVLGAGLQFTFLDGMIATGFTLYLIFYRNLTSRTFWMRPLGFFGDLSFCLYLIHVACTWTFDTVTLKLHFGPAVGWTSTLTPLMCRTVIVLIAATLIAMASRRWFELPILKHKDYVR